MSHAEGTTEAAVEQYELPSPVACQHALAKAEERDCAVYMDYWRDSLNGTAMIGIRGDNSKLLVKSASEYTSTIEKMFKAENAYLVLTENSLYLVSAGISSCNISE